jgi:hypothetical protein
VELSLYVLEPQLRIIRGYELSDAQDETMAYKIRHVIQWDLTQCLDIFVAQNLTRFILESLAYQYCSETDGQKPVRHIQLSRTTQNPIAKRKSD